MDTDSDRVDFWFSINNCAQYECWSEGWLDGGGQDKDDGPQQFVCPEIKISNVFYNAGFLEFDIISESGAQFDYQCVNGDVHDAKGDYWTAVRCCSENQTSPSDYMFCAGQDPVTVRTGSVNLSISFMGLSGQWCHQTVPFSPPSYTANPDEKKPSDDGCPSGESPCGTTGCCSDGHCECSGGVCGCY
jgi:hypothetical protein